MSLQVDFTREASPLRLVFTLPLNISDYVYTKQVLTSGDVSRTATDSITYSQTKPHSIFALKMKSRLVVPFGPTAHTVLARCIAA